MMRTQSSVACAGGNGSAFEREVMHRHWSDPPAGYIFMCNGKTKPECFQYRVFGLPRSGRKVVEKIKPGTKLFLFDFEKKLLYGVYEATSEGSTDLEPEAFGGQFPAQVKFRIFKGCVPLHERSFKSVIQDNYTGTKFKQELDEKQVANLISLYAPLPDDSPRTEFHDPASGMLLSDGQHGDSYPSATPPVKSKLLTALYPYLRDLQTPHDHHHLKQPTPAPVKHSIQTIELGYYSASTYSCSTGQAPTLTNSYRYTDSQPYQATGHTPASINSYQPMDSQLSYHAPGEDTALTNSYQYADSQQAYQIIGRPSALTNSYQYTDSQQAYQSTGHPSASTISYQYADSQQAYQSTGHPSVSTASYQYADSQQAYQSTGHPSASTISYQYADSQQAYQSTGHPSASTISYQYADSGKGHTTGQAPNVQHAWYEAYQSAALGNQLVGSGETVPHQSIAPAYNHEVSMQAGCSNGATMAANYNHQVAPAGYASSTVQPQAWYQPHTSQYASYPAYAQGS